MAEAVMWIAYRKRLRIESKRIIEKRKESGGPIKSLPQKMRQRLDKAARQLVDWIVEGRVKAGGHRYKFQTAPNVGDRYEEIPVNFLRSGVCWEPANDIIMTDPALSNNEGGFLHYEIRGYAMVTIDEDDLANCIREATTTSAVSAAILAEDAAKWFESTPLPSPTELPQKDVADLPSQNFDEPASAPMQARAELPDSELTGWVTQRVARLGNEDPPAQETLRTELKEQFQHHHVSRVRFRKAIRRTPLHVPNRGKRR